MTLWENNLSPYATFVEGTTPASPAAGQQRLFVDSADHKVKRVNSAGAVTIVEGGGGASSPLTTKGDVWTYSTTDARLAIGTNGQVFTADSTQTTGNKYAYPPGYQFDRATISANVTVTATAWGSAVTVVTGNAVSYDGSTEVILEFYTPEAISPGGGNNVFASFFDGATQLGAAAVGASTSQAIAPLLLKQFWTPSNASHTITVKSIISASGTGTISAGNGSGALTNAFLRITKA